MRNATDSCRNFRPHVLPLLAFMFDVCPASAKVLTRGSRETLLHYACRNVVKLPTSFTDYISLIRLLIKAFSESVNVCNDNGMLPFHVVCKTWSPYWDYYSDMAFLFREDVNILSESSGSRKAKDSYSRTPLHCLCIQEAPLEVIAVLLSLQVLMTIVAERHFVASSSESMYA